MLGTIIAMGLGILVGAYAILGGHTPTYDPSDIMQGKFVVIGSLVMFFSVVTTNIMSLYSISMSSMVLVRQRWCALERDNILSWSMF